MVTKSPELLKTKEITPGKIIPINVLTSQDASAHNPEYMEQAIKPRKKQPTVYPLRFRSKAQRERLEKAAKSVHKTLKDFFLDLGEKAASDTDSGLRAS